MRGGESPRARDARVMRTSGARAAGYARSSDHMRHIRRPEVAMKVRAPLLLSLLAFTISVVAQSRSPIDLANASVPAGARRIAYGSEPLQFGELRVPSTNGPHPVAIVVHGGCWLAKLGDMDERAVSMEMIRPVAAALTDAGIATWNIEYRRLGNVGGGWPANPHRLCRGPQALECVIAITHSSAWGPRQRRWGLAGHPPPTFPSRRYSMFHVAIPASVNAAATGRIISIETARSSMSPSFASQQP